MKRLTLICVAWSCGLWAWGADAGRAQQEEAWVHLVLLRTSLEAPGGVAATFEQTFIPAGFTEGEQETGQVAFDLPVCLRWDYDEPFPKSYLLCGHTAWSWNRGEESGRRYVVGAEDESGLELLRLDLEQLRERYRATVEAAADGRWRVQLEPQGEETPILDAELLIEREGDRLAALAYHDREGNLTRFTFSDYRPVADPSRFDPPRTLSWITQ